jgi:hypothetical protein
MRGLDVTQDMALSARADRRIDAGKSGQVLGRPVHAAHDARWASSS